MKKSSSKGSGYRGEFFLSSASTQSVWNQIATSRGLSEWFAPKVDITGNELHVYWDNKGDDRKGIIVKHEPKQQIKWIWEDDPDSYLSMEIIYTELSNSVSLIVDDHDEGLDTETLEELWGNHLERLHSTLGI